MNTSDIGDIGSALTKLMSDPEMLKKAVSMASVLKESGIGSILSDTAEKEENGNSDGNERKQPETKALAGNTESHRTALINALKPYLSEKRQAKAEMLIGLLAVFELLGRRTGGENVQP